MDSVVFWLFVALVWEAVMGWMRAEQADEPIEERHIVLVCTIYIHSQYSRSHSHGGTRVDSSRPCCDTSLEAPL